ncbi:hypothetical protein Dimus_033135 [Dionaea muscipula]
MGSTLNNLGESLPVPFVQELAKAPLTQLPARYVRTDLPDLQLNPSINSELEEVPVINHKLLTSPNVLGFDDEVTKLDQACREWGFFQLVNHGVGISLLEKLRKEILGFFHMPLEEKNKYAQVPGGIEGYGQAFVGSEEQKLDWGDMFYVDTLPKLGRNPRIFNQLPAPFREAIEEYADEIRKLTLTVLECMAKALKIDGDELHELKFSYAEGNQGMRMSYYPPCPQPDLAIGLSSHSDVPGLTFLLQVNEVEGLQIKKDGRWIPVKPLPHAFIVNIGDTLEISTNGIYKSIEHRVVVNLEDERLSIAAFNGPKLDAEIGPVSSLITPQCPAKYRSTKVEDYFKAYFARELRGKALIGSLKIQDTEALDYMFEDK